MQIQTKMRYHLIPVRMAIINKTIHVGEVVEEKELSFTAGGNVNWCSYYGKQYEIPPPKIKNGVTI